MNRLNSTIILIFLFTVSAYSKATTTDSRNVELINIANKQRMLSQRITKAYLYAGNGKAIDRSNRQIKRALIDFKKSYKKINGLTNNPKVKKVMNFLERSSGDFNTISKKPLNTKNAKLILKLSESVLNKSENMVSMFKKSLKGNSSEFIIRAGQQGMLAQRIAKYYIAYRSGIKDKETKKNMRESVELFAQNHRKLMRYKGNSSNIKKKLKETDRLWNIVYKFYVNIEKGGLPLIVFNATDNITKQMDEVTQMYVATY